MERPRRIAGCTFSPLWTVCGLVSKRSETTSFIKSHLIEIQRDFFAVIQVRAALGSGAVGADAGRARRLLPSAPAMEAGGRVEPLGEGQEGPRGVQRRNHGRHEDARE